jgi:ribonuclease D
VQLLRGRRLTTLQALAAWRERTARTTDQPRNWVLKDEILLDLAKMQPSDQAALSGLRGLNQQTINRYGTALLELIAASKDRDPQPLPEEHRSMRLTPAQEAVVELLATAVRMIGERHALHPSAITSRRELERLAQGDRDVDVLQGWRRKLAGETLLSVLQGQTGLKVIGGAVEFIGA